MASESEIIAVLRTIYAAYPRNSAAPETVRLFVEALSDLPAAELQAAAAAWVQTERYPPSVAELRVAVAEVRRRSSSAPAVPSMPAEDPRLRAKFALYGQNIRDWLDGRCTTAEMVLRGASIYASVPPIPPDGAAVRRDAEAFVQAELGDRGRRTGAGALAQLMGRSVDRR